MKIIGDLSCSKYSFENDISWAFCTGCHEPRAIRYVGNVVTCLYGHLRLIHTCHVAPMLCRVDSHMPCRATAVFRQCRVLRESPRGNRKYPNCWSYSLTDWYASVNNFCGTPRGRRRKPKAGRSPTCRLWTADANSHVPCHAMPRCAVALRSRFQNGMVVAWYRRGMACVNQTLPHCVNHMGKTQSKPLEARHDMCEFVFIVLK
jgi:hypothetical protein